MQIAPKTIARNELESSIIRRATSGDESAFTELVERYKVPVYNLLWRMTEVQLGQGRTEELLQDVFVKVYQALGRFSGAGKAKLSTWIFTIATRTALKELRRPRLLLPIENGIDLPDSAALSPEGELMRRRNARVIRRVIGELKPEHRAVLVLREYHGLDYSEVAEALEIDIGTVKSRLWRARRILREALSEVYDG